MVHLTVCGKGGIRRVGGVAVLGLSVLLGLIGIKVLRVIWVMWVVRVL